MQHYRAPTRLLDWTASPFVAAFFAYSTKPSHSKDPAAVWALNAPFFRSVFGQDVPGPVVDHLGVVSHTTTQPDGTTTVEYPGRTADRRSEENDLVRWVIGKKSPWPLPVLPFDPDPRMSAQQSVFTCIGNVEVPLDGLADKRNWTHPGFRSGFWYGPESVQINAYEPPHVMRKFLLPGDERKKALASLHRMGISSASLFPGLDGIGDATSMHLNLGGRSLWQGLTP
jgi:hypothetical protein